MPRVEHTIKTKYDDPRLAEPTKAQMATLELLKAKNIGLSICGVVKAASRRKLYLIDRHGNVTMSARAYGKWL
jgi:hypothetical protein